MRKRFHKFDPGNPVLPAMAYCRLTPVELGKAANIERSRLYCVLRGELLSVPRRILNVFESGGLNGEAIQRNYKEWRKEKSEELHNRVAEVGMAK